MRTSDFDYELPPELIAQEPAPRRDRSRLLVVRREDGHLEDSTFDRLPEHLRAGDVLVVNRSRVIPARLRGRLHSGSEFEILLVRRMSEVEWEVMARPARRLRLGARLQLPEGVEAEVCGLLQEGRRLIRFEFIDGGFDPWLKRAGELPIPPYVRTIPPDPERYQTVYSTVEGSIAAPTAGLHFTHDIMRRLEELGVDIRRVTLHVGPGTFKPVTSEDVEAVRLEPELGEIDHETSNAINRAKADGRRVVAVGTTTTRLIEGRWRAKGGLVAWTGPVDLFIRPPFTFHVVDALITNFHLPRSTLLMLVSAFAGRDLVGTAYGHAIAHGYRFYSFGDAMLIL